MRPTSMTFTFAPALALGLLFAGLAAAQPGGPAVPANPAPPKVYSNPRAGADDPRIGVKGGLYDAGEAAFGMQRIATLPKPTGFGPGTDATASTATAPPPTEPGAAGGEAGRGGGGGPGGSYGPPQSHPAFRGHHPFVGDYNGVQLFPIPKPSKITPGGAHLWPR